MGHEDAVYLAKLAEQAERYEGMFLADLSPVESKESTGRYADYGQ